MRSSKKVIMETSSGTIADLIFLRNLIEEGKLTTVIDRDYPLEETADAHRDVETGAKKGNVVITGVTNDKTGQSGLTGCNSLVVVAKFDISRWVVTQL